MPPEDSLLPQTLLPAYVDWVHRPGEMLSFWLWTGPEAMKDQITRTGANAASLHAMMHVVQDDKSPIGVMAVTAKEQLGWMALSPGKTLDQLGVDAGAGIGEHNNAWFVRYPDWFWQLHPSAAMQDKDGRVIRAGDNPFPATNDSVLSQVSREQMGGMARALRDEMHVRYWVLGGEQSYPDYFGLPEGDYRPDALKQYHAWQQLHGVASRPGEDEAAWRTFRESAFVDYYAGDTAFLRGQDPSRPILIPTHGNPFALDFRTKIGYPVGDLAGVADGFEAGPISIDDDPERLIRLTLDQQTSFGVPVAAPRLANKQLDPSARGGGRSFSPESLRRTVYEALGLGVWHLGLVQWMGSLNDGEWGIAGTPAEAECKRIFGELKQAAPYLEGCSRLRPQVGIFISDATWKRRWQDRWTLLYDEAIKRGWHVMLLTDVQIAGEMAKDTPVIVSVDNPIVAQRTRARLSEYTKAGGTIISVGALGTDDGHDHRSESVPGVMRVPDDAPGAPIKVIHQTQTIQGAATWSADARPLPMDALETAVSKQADVRPVRLIGPMGQATAVEPLILTDGTNLILVLINRSDKAQDVRLEASPRIRAHLGNWTARDLVTGNPCKNAKVHLAPHGTALIGIEPHHAGDTKAYARSRMADHNLAIKPTVQYRNGSLDVEAQAWTPQGKPASGAQVRVRLVPGTYEWHSLRETKPGAYSLQLPEDALPRFYNPSSGKYELAEGLTQLVFDASLGTLRGGARTVIRLR